MITPGEEFKEIKSGEIFQVKTITPKLIILTTRDGCRAMFVNPVSMGSVLLPVDESEPKEDQ